MDKQPDPEQLLNEILSSLGSFYESPLSGDCHELLDRWLDRAVMLQEIVEIADRSTRLTGWFSGITETGSLVLRMSDGHMREVHVGEMVRGPVENAVAPIESESIRHIGAVGKWTMFEPFAYNR